MDESFPRRYLIHSSITTKIQKLAVFLISLFQMMYEVSCSEPSSLPRQKFFGFICLGLRDNMRAVIIVPVPVSDPSLCLKFFVKACARKRCGDEEEGRIYLIPVDKLQRLLKDRDIQSESRPKIKARHDANAMV